MIKVLYIPQVNTKDALTYEFNGRKMTAKLNGETDLFDFSDMPEGKLEGVESDLPIDPIISAKVEKGVLYLELRNFIGPDAPYEDRFPTWKEV